MFLLVNALQTTTSIISSEVIDRCWVLLTRCLNFFSLNVLELNILNLLENMILECNRSFLVVVGSLCFLSMLNIFALSIRVFFAINSETVFNILFFFMMTVKFWPFFLKHVYYFHQMK